MHWTTFNRLLDEAERLDHEAMDLMFSKKWMMRMMAGIQGW